jgi:NhaP-type Na+/H+ or K+/H+ antiporter
LFTFILFGSSLIWQGLVVLDGATLLFALAVVLIRPVVFFLSLTRAQLDQRSRLIIAWFGPRGLSSLLLILIPVFAGIPQAERLFFICCLVVLLSVLLHGVSLMLLGREEAPATAMAEAQTAAEAPACSVGQTGSAAVDNKSDRISIEELAALQATRAPVLIVDVRADASFNSSDSQVPGALRIPPDQLVRRLTELNVPRHSWIILFCA